MVHELLAYWPKQLWLASRVPEHPALAKYRYMPWLDTDAFVMIMRGWQQDLVGYFIQDDLVLLFDNFPQGSANCKGPEVQGRLQRDFGTGLCTVRLKEDGRVQVKTSKDCSSRIYAFCAWLSAHDSLRPRFLSYTYTEPASRKVHRDVDRGH